uniref:RNase III domain-containing protein n=1 Tax=viral metagenome TaxID=1070528 RepID=A0A6C0CQ54_9ZZZZ
MILIHRFELTCLLKYIRPRNMSFYQSVFVHKSSLKNLQNHMYTGTISSNERLEFLGDAVISLITTDYLYERFQYENEGFLTKLRIKYIKGRTLASLASSLGMERYIILSSNTCINDNILENAFEALIGAIYLDYKQIDKEGYFVCKFLHGLFQDELDLERVLANDDNYKDILMRYSQKQKINLPEYAIKEVSGQAHKPMYTICLNLKLNDVLLHTTCFTASTKKEAEQHCAYNMLSQLGLIASTAVFQHH